MGTLYQRGRIWWLKYWHKGKPVRESSKSRKKAVAKHLLEQREGEIAQGKLPGIYFDKVTLAELAEDFLNDYRINGRKSIERAEYSAKRLNEHFGDVRASAIDVAEVRRYAEKRLADGAARATVNRELAALRRMFTLGSAAGKVDRSPHVPRLRENNVRTGFFEHDEFLKLRDELPQYLKGLVTFAYRSGWRLGEIVNLKWSQVDRQAGIVTLNAGETKNNEGRTLYLDSELKAVIEAQWRLRTHLGKIVPYVFTNKAGTDRIRDFRWYWEKACSQANLGARLFHDFRRTAIRNMVRAGVSERVAMSVSGHRTRSIFDRYDIVSDGDLKMAAQRQEAYLNEKCAQTGTFSGTVTNFPTATETARKLVSPCQ